MCVFFPTKYKFQWKFLPFFTILFWNAQAPTMSVLLILTNKKSITTIERERENHRIWFCIKIYNKDAIPCRFYAKPLVNPLFSFDLFNWSIALHEIFASGFFSCHTDSSKQWVLIPKTYRDKANTNNSKAKRKCNSKIEWIKFNSF